MIQLIPPCSINTTTIIKMYDRYNIHTRDTTEPHCHMQTVTTSAFFVFYFLYDCLPHLLTFSLYILGPLLPYSLLSFLLCLRAIPFSFRLVRKLPWLSRQSDRLLTDRSLVRSQAEAPFLLFTIIILTKFIPYIQTNKKYASRGSRTHDRAVKSRALYRLSQEGY